jgi:hypothetical protein
MENKNMMTDKLRALAGMKRQKLELALGQPDIALEDMAYWKRNGLWMVLHFVQEQVSGICFFDAEGRLLRSHGIRLPEMSEEKLVSFTSLRTLIQHCGPPHSLAGSGLSYVHYLTRDGKLLLIRHADDTIANISMRALADFEPHSSRSEEV